MGGPPHGHGRGPYDWRKRRRDFWRQARDEMRQRWQEEGHDRPWPPGPPTAEMASMWREAFHQFMGAWPEDHWAFGGRRFSPWHKGIDTFNPFVASLLSKGGGLLPLIVMNLLADRTLLGAYGKAARPIPAAFVEAKARRMVTLFEAPEETPA